MPRHRTNGLVPISEILPGLKLPKDAPENGQPLMRIDPCDLIADDIAYTHAVFAQCFLPVRSPKKGTLRHQVKHGNASLIVHAGELIDPTEMHKTEVREIPAGPKARLLMAYINNQAIRNRSPEIDLGDSLREFMERSGVPIGGRNGHEIKRQVKNIAACQMILGVWGEDRAVQNRINISDGITFWLEKDLNQRTLWQPTMTLASDYMAVIDNHRVPLDFRGLVGLQASPRAMDIFVWLSYRLCRIRRGKPVKIPYAALHAIFGQGKGRVRDFKREFTTALNLAHQYYPDAHVELQSDHIICYASPSPVPGTNTVRLPKHRQGR